MRSSPRTLSPSRSWTWSVVGTSRYSPTVRAAVGIIDAPPAGGQVDHDPVVALSDDGERVRELGAAVRVAHQRLREPLRVAARDDNVEAGAARGRHDLQRIAVCDGVCEAATVEMVDGVEPHRARG